MISIISVFIGGGLGSLARYGVSFLVTNQFSKVNPVATLISNLASTILLGIVVLAMAYGKELNSTVKTLVIIGFCGGFSTFSTFSYEIFELMREGNLMYAALNIIISLIAGVGSLFLVAKIV